MTPVDPRTVFELPPFLRGVCNGAGNRGRRKSGQEGNLAFTSQCEKFFYSMAVTTDNFLDRAFELAEEALGVGEVPVGCVVVLENDSSSVVIGEGRNEVNATKNACQHAEMVAIGRILQNGQYDHLIFSKCTIYVTVEPCIMCADALTKLSILRIVFCCRNERFGGAGSVMNVPGENSNIEVIQTCHESLRNRAIDLLQRFYSGENPNAPAPKLKEKQRKP